MVAELCGNMFSAAQTKAAGSRSHSEIMLAFVAKTARERYIAFANLRGNSTESAAAAASFLLVAVER